MSLNKILYFLAFLAFLFVWIFTPLIDEDEGLMAEISREMLVSGDFLSTKMNGEIRFDKPPFFNWLQVFAFKTFGLNNFAARFPSVVFCGVWVYFTYKIAKTFNLKNENTIFFLFFSSFQIVILSLAGIQETINNSCFCAIIYFIFFANKLSLNLRKILIAIFISISFLTKGPLVFLLILLIILLKFIASILIKPHHGINIKFELIEALQLLFSFKTIAIILVLIMPWNFLMYQKYNFVFVEGFYLKHNINRFLETKESHGGNYFYYLIIVFVGNIAFFPMILTSIYKELKTNSDSIFLSILVVVFLFFSLSSTKLHHYVVIAYPALILIVYKHNLNGSLQHSFTIFLFFKFVLLIVLISFYFEIFVVNDNYFKAILIDSKLEIVQFGILVFLLILLNLFLKKYNQIIHLSFINFIFSLGFFYFVGNAMQKPIIEIAQKIMTQNLDIKALSHYHPSLSFYSKRVLKMGEEQSANYIFGNINELKNQKGKIIFSKSGLVILEK